MSYYRIRGRRKPPSAGAIAGAALLGRSTLPQDDPRALTDEERQALEQFAPRGAPVQYERADAESLALHVLHRWWAPGFARHRGEAGNVREGLQGLKEGGVSDWPDFTLLVPPCIRTLRWTGGPPESREHAVTAALELKSIYVRPGTPRGGADQLGALTPGQLRQLRCMRACGWQTCVAYGWAQALAWLDKVAGPEPTELPTEWR